MGGKDNFLIKRYLDSKVLLQIQHIWALYFRFQIQYWLLPSQVQLLKLSHTIIILEDQLFSLKDDTDTGILPDNEWECYRIKHIPNNSLAFIRTARFSCQGILLTAMLSALKQHHNCHIHRHWVSLLTDSLPYLEYGLPKMAIPVVNQLCRNLEVLSVLYKPLAVSSDSTKK